MAIEHLTSERLSAKTIARRTGKFILEWSGAFAALFHVFVVPYLFTWPIEPFGLSPAGGRYSQFFMWGKHYPPANSFLEMQYKDIDMLPTKFLSVVNMIITNIGLSLRNNSLITLCIILILLFVMWLHFRYRSRYTTMLYYRIITAYFAFYLVVAVTAALQINVCVQFSP